MSSLPGKVVTAFLLYVSSLTLIKARDPVNFEAKLLNDLRGGYSRNARPIVDVRKPIDVSISLYLTKILNLDEKNQILTTFGWLEVHWRDEFLVWNASHYGGVKRIIVPPKMIWLPDFGLENSAESIYDDQADKKFRAGIDFDGEVQWVPGGKFVTSCQLDITFYPFDDQHCEMDFVDWTYDGRFVNLINGTEKVGTDVYKRNGEWDIIDTQALKIDQYFDSDPGIPFPTVKFILHLRRKPRFYMVNIIAPCVLMSTLALLVFYLPPDSGEKVSLGITVLLSFSVFLLLIAENVPKTSDCVPLIGIYLTMIMTMTAISIVISVIVLDLHHHEPTTPVPRWLHKFAFSFAARVMCMKGPYSTERANNLYAVTHGTSRRGKAEGGEGVEENGIREEERLISVSGPMKSVYEDFEFLVTTKKKTLLFEEILQHLRDITSKMKSNVKRDQIRLEWQTVAKVIDRFLLMIFFVAIVSLSVSILVLYPHFGRKQGMSGK